jgi:(2R)-3-sulfolactate dehydrogenase (NADP+)
MVELLAAGLTGAIYAADASSFLDDKGPPPGTGQLILALDPVALGGPDALARFGALASAIEAQPGTRLPGARRRALRTEAEARGIEVAEALLKEIRA